jgi:hypothetical protein
MLVQRFADWRWAGFSAQKLVRRTELSATTKLSSGDETPPIANLLLGVRSFVVTYSSFLKSKIRGLCLEKQCEKYCPQSSQ